MVIMMMMMMMMMDHFFTVLIANVFGIPNFQKIRRKIEGLRMFTSIPPLSRIISSYLLIHMTFLSVEKKKKGTRHSSSSVLYVYVCDVGLIDCEKHLTQIRTVLQLKGIVWLSEKTKRKKNVWCHVL